MKLSFEKIIKHIEWVPIPVGKLTLVLSLLGIDCAMLIGLVGILCIIYILYAVYLLTQRPKFGWQ